MQKQFTAPHNFFFFVADESDILYNPLVKGLCIKAEKEEIRAKFLVELLEKHGYKIKDIRLDVEGPKFEILGSSDLVAFKDDEPFLITQFLSKKPSITEISFARDSLFEKMKDLKPKYGILAGHNKKEFFLLKNGKITKIFSLPHH
ncbi:MAG: hypothetical protein PHW31_02585 [Candidatus Pacebacteria bacterium]|nr:hypothetical protein [Candidatus Paceibacterota bacterium]